MRSVEAHGVGGQGVEVRRDRQLGTPARMPAYTPT
jgi:hypothetical protein